MSPRYHVYTLTDPRDLSVFYVGKGRGGRPEQHESMLRRGRPSGNLSEDARIRDVLSEGGKVLVDVVGSFNDESEALSHEAALIATIPGLLNVSPGYVRTMGYLSRDRLSPEELRIGAVFLFGERSWASSLAKCLGVERTQVWRWTRSRIDVPGPVSAAMRAWLRIFDLTVERPMAT